MTPGLIDTHAHLMDSAFDADRDLVVQRARDAGVAAMMVVGSDLASSRAAVELARRLPGTRAAVGIHPNSVSDAAESDFEAIAELAGVPEVAGIGETGLDNFRQFTPHQRQREAFHWHLSLAEELRLPVIVHNRDADDEIAAAVQSHAAIGVLHCFTSGDPGYLEQLLNRGFFISFAGMLTFKNPGATREMARRVPMERLLVETDSPLIAPVPHRGRRNEPAFVRETARCLADVIGTPFNVLVQTLWANSVRLFPALAVEASAS